MCSHTVLQCITDVVVHMWSHSWVLLIRDSKELIHFNELLKRHFNAYLSVPAYLRSHWFVTRQCGCADQVELNRILFAGKAKMNLHISPTPENAKHYWSICIFTLNWSGDLTTIFLLCWILTLKFSNYCQLNLNNEKLCGGFFGL